MKGYNYFWVDNPMAAGTKVDSQEFEDALVSWLRQQDMSENELVWLNLSGQRSLFRHESPLSFRERDH